MSAFVYGLFVCDSGMNKKEIWSKHGEGMIFIGRLCEAGKLHSHIEVLTLLPTFQLHSHAFLETRALYLCSCHVTFFEHLFFLSALAEHKETYATLISDSISFFLSRAADALRTIISH